jgi:putative transposase
VPRKTFTEEQIVAALKKAESGVSVADVCRQTGVTEMTFYRWKRKYAGSGIAELRRLKLLEEENRNLNQIVADLALDKAMFQQVIAKVHGTRPSGRTLYVTCESALELARDEPAEFLESVVRYHSQAKDHSALRIRIRDFANS